MLPGLKRGRPRRRPNAFVNVSDDFINSNTNPFDKNRRRQKELTSL
jgi:hypothetical protein